MLSPRSVVARRALSVACATSLWLAAAAAAAQDRDPAAAQALFDQAKELSRQGKFAEACPKLQESNRLDPGIGTQFHLADCYEQSGRVASAWAQFLDVASQARATGQFDREKAAQKRAEKLQPRLPKLVVTVPEGSKTPGLEIRRNGVLVGSAQWGGAVPVDPGEVELTASAPGKQTLRQSLRLEEGKTANFSLPALAQGTSQPATAAPAGSDASASPAPPAAAPVPVAAPAPGAPPSDEPPAKAGSSNTGWVLTLAGLGVVGLGVGTTFAIMAKNDYNSSLGDCDSDDPNACGDMGLGLRDDARSKGNIATVGFIAGGALLAGAGIVWLTSGSSSDKKTATTGRFRAAPVVAPNHAALYFQGSF